MVPVSQSYQTVVHYVPLVRTNGIEYVLMIMNVMYVRTRVQIYKHYLKNNLKYKHSAGATGTQVGVVSMYTRIRIRTIVCTTGMYVCANFQSKTGDVTL